MSNLNSNSTLAEVQAAYDDNASYAEDNSAAKARAFVTACRMLIRRLPAESGSREAHLRLSPELIQQQIEEARRWLEAYDVGQNATAGPRVTRSGFEFFRLP